MRTVHPEAAQASNALRLMQCDGKGGSATEVARIARWGDDRLQAERMGRASFGVRAAVRPCQQTRGQLTMAWFTAPHSKGRDGTSSRFSLSQLGGCCRGGDRMLSRTMAAWRAVGG